MPQSFTIVMVPDPHPEAEYTAWTAETQWISDNRVARNIQAVLCTGDFKLTGDSWSYGWDTIDAMGVPYLSSPGNHDSTVDGGRDTHFYDSALGYTRINGKSWFTGYYSGDSTNKSNMAIEFVANGLRILVVALEFFPRKAAVQWATGIINAHPMDYTIILTHAQLYNTSDGVAHDYPFSGVIYGPSTYGLTEGDPGGPDNYSGEALLAWAKQFVNVRLILCGHYPGGNALRQHSQKTVTGDNGNTIHQIMSCYQAINDPGSMRGDEWLTLLTFQQSAAQILVDQYRCYDGASNASWPTYDLSLEVVRTFSPFAGARSL